ncbi:MAG: hypothetical protein HLUCCA11_18395 [Phormidesmis priestleyi Ana]|uniref:Uncharacterized protein n=1 Tax=Phormidesmis priestleyi Ana TaxID=1666911 RepID=A0A0P7ZTD7_9CYAN|nr:MAG: hypothetical protein HLUCCA11_18395 [Phormidesmis priestleyi Ana]
MTRTYSTFNTELSKAQLAQLADKSTAPDAYKDAMTLLGELLGEVVSAQIDNSNAGLYLACTVEDVDYLAKGMLGPLENSFQSVSLACFWNERFSPFNVQGIQASPIIRKYSEPQDKAISHLVIVKSIISSGCVVKTNLTDLIQTIHPQKIFIVAPVIYSGAEERLAAEFEASVYEKFQFIYLAEDDERTDEGEVIPGIGGMVYDRLGFSGQDDKNRYIPELVKARRRQLVTSTGF